MQLLATPEILRNLIHTNKTPFYLYNKRIIKDTIEEIRSAFPISGFELLFATMANDNEEFLQNIAANNVGACVNSIDHLAKVLKNGIPSNKIQYTSTGLSSEDLPVLFKNRIEVNFDSI